jgi:hypothetical protein
MTRARYWLPRLATGALLTLFALLALAVLVMLTPID